MKRQASEFPLFWTLKPASQAALMQFYYDLSGEKLDIPKYPEHIKPSPVIDEGKSELERLMRQPPRAEGRGGY